MKIVVFANNVPEYAKSKFTFMKFQAQLVVNEMASLRPAMQLYQLVNHYYTLA